MDTTIGGASANSYATAATADAYHLARGHATWTGTDAVKEAALLRATAWLDGRYRSRWPGCKLNGRLQALDWPRYAYDHEGWPIDTLAIPVEVVNAVCEAALVELVTPNALLPSVTPGTAKVLTGLKGITWTPLRTGAGAYDMAPTLLVVEALLSGIIGSAGNLKLVRG